MTTILILEDEPTFRELLWALLSEEGYAVEVVRNGLQALAALPLVRPEVIISDIMMPVLDGLEFYAGLQSHASFAGTPVIFLSAVSQPVFQLQRGRTLFLPKPIEMETLLRNIVAILSPPGLQERAVGA
jgi:CheY-like chemotaxis protein